MKEIRLLKEKTKADNIKEKSDGLMAAMKIQKVWRGHTARRKTRRKKMEEMILIGMVPLPPNKGTCDAVDRMNEVCWLTTNF